ncbi:hypothetical protein JW964_12015 [candidate division KSB1 bacterium]|nr:hypothetical protein [candidate division KSB1 bacterium]
MESLKQTTIKIFSSFRAFFMYNLKIIFANKFIYFFIASIIIYALIAFLNIVNSDTVPKASSIYNILFFSGIILIFYPCVYGIQLDLDAGMLETLFGIPNYRYKVWLIRLAITFVLVAGIIYILALISHLVIASISVVEMTFQLMFPLIFWGCLAFLLATLTRSGHGAAVSLIIIGLILWITSEFIEGTRWDLFHNPFTESQNVNLQAYEEITFYNRIILLSGAIVTLLWGLLNLQKREKYV